MAAPATIAIHDSVEHALGTPTIDDSDSLAVLLKTLQAADESELGIVLSWVALIRGACKVNLRGRRGRDNRWAAAAAEMSHGEDKGAHGAA